MTKIQPPSDLFKPFLAFSCKSLQSPIRQGLARGQWPTMVTEDDLSDRMRMLMTALGCRTQKDLARLVGVSYESVNRWANGTRKPSRSHLSLMAQHLHIHPSKVFRYIEDGEPLPELKIPAQDRTRIGVLPPGGRAGFMPHFNRVPAAWGAETTDMGYPVGEADAWLPNLSGFADAFSARAEGDSMEPLICNGDRITCSPSAEIKDGSIVYVRFDGTGKDENCIRRVYREPDGGVLLLPLNAKHGPRRFKGDEIIRMVRVVEVSREV